MVDINGPHLQQKHKQMTDAGMNVAPLDAPTSTPLAGWEMMTVVDIAKKLPRVTSSNTCSLTKYVLDCCLSGLFFR